MEIRCLAEVFVMSFARNQGVSRAGFLLESVSILQITIENDGVTRPWMRAASRPTNS